ncbi:MAG: alpha-L-rhamnosidase [Clostridia bacterium]|nr:alpha-L-rhamnosidase [Clostridia bacterium]
MQYVYPKKIIATQGFDCVENFRKEKPLQIGLQEQDLAIVRGKGYVIFDFGKELSGGVRILTFLIKGNKTVRLRFGESVGETCAEIGEKNATNDHSLRDFCVELQNYSDMTFGQTGFRFLRIDTLCDDTEISFKAVVAAVNMDEREQVGTFTCDDRLVNQIFDTAAYTLRLCLQNGYIWDGVKRDRLVWIGDLYPEMRAAHCLYGDIPEITRCLDFAMQETPLPNWMAGIHTYSVWWLIILCDEYTVRGDKGAFEKYLPYVKGLLAQIAPYVAQNGETSFGSDFIDWATSYEDGDEEKRRDCKVGAYYLTKIALTKTLAFLRAYGEDTSLCEELLQRQANYTPKAERFKQMAGLGAWSGDLSENNKNLLVAGGAKGLSTFMSYPILTGAAACGEYETALNMMKEYYGGMLSVGATTFWEDFDLSWLENGGRIDELPTPDQKDIHGDYGGYCYKGYRHSLCHGWSAGVVAYLMETVVGIQPQGTGLREIKIHPNLSGLKQVKATYPTPYGLLKIEHELQSDGSVKTTLDVPNGVKIVP